MAGLVEIAADPPLPGRDVWVGFHRDLRRLRRLCVVLDAMEVGPQPDESAKCGRSLPRLFFLGKNDEIPANISALFFNHENCSGFSFRKRENG